MKIGLTNDDILCLNIDLTYKCNLLCPLCMRACIKNNNIMLEERELSFQEWKNIIDKFKNVKTILFVGSICEPTLYKDLFMLIDYIKSKNINIEMDTNGNTHDEKWWNELRKHLTKNDILQFVICGSTQELHAKYRIGSDLNLLLSHAAAFRKNNPNKNDRARYLIFEYNKNDIKKQSTINMLLNFSAYDIFHSFPRQELYHLINSENTDIKMCYKYNLAYKYIQNSYLKHELPLLKQNKTFKINCPSLLSKTILIGYLGQIYPCDRFPYNALIDASKFNMCDFSNILNFDFECCYEHEKHFTDKILKIFGKELEHMCI